MRENPFRQDNEEIKELVRQFQNLKAGRGNSFLEEEAFEKIIDYFDDVEDLPQALEAAERGLAIAPEHISAYGYIPEEGTPLGDAVARGQEVPRPESLMFTACEASPGSSTCIPLPSSLAR
jgi:hypothetical protein